MTPLGKGAEAPFVAKPDGTRRELSQLEADYLKRQTPKRRGRLY